MSWIEPLNDDQQQEQPYTIRGTMRAGEQPGGGLYVAPLGADPDDPSAWTEVGQAGPVAVDLEPFIGEPRPEVISFHRASQVLVTDGALVEIPGRMGMASVYDLVRRAWCRCPRLPWSPHRHRFDLGDRS